MLSETEILSLPARKAYRKIANEVTREASNQDILQAQKKAFQTAMIFHAEVLNGGISQYFTNSFGEHYQDVLISLKVVGAIAQENLLYRCVAILSGNVDLRNRVQVGAYIFGNPQVLDQIKEIDKEYLASLPTFYQAMVDFAIANKVVFRII